MAVTFQKMHGAGNDFVVLDLREQDFPINANTAAQLADRHTGVGCDQVLVLRHGTGAGQLASFEVWNADGSRAEQCGNGVRCLGLYLDMRRETPDGQFLLGGPAGIVKVSCLASGQFQVDMGKPVFDPSRVPVLLEPVDGWFTVNVDQHRHRIGTVSMGNPHALLIVDDIDAANVDQMGSTISHHPVFPEGCNVGFVQIENRDSIRLRVYERGAAETLACGSGACAAMSILRRAGLVDETVKVTQTGGILIITWIGGQNPVMMTGPAAHIYDGVLK